MNTCFKPLFLAIALIVAACSSCKKDSTSSTGGDGDTTTTGSTDTNPDPIDVTSCSSDTGVNRIICLANAFKSQLSSSQLETVQLSYSITDAKKWSNFPQALVASAYKRVGLSFGAMTTTQIQYAKALIKAVAGDSDNE